MPDQPIKYSSIDDFRDEVTDVTEMEGFEYPAILLSNIAHTITLQTIKENKIDSVNTLPVWVKTVDDEFVKLGTLNLTIEMLHLLKMLMIGVTLYIDPDTVMHLDLSDPETLEKFV